MKPSEKLAATIQRKSLDPKVATFEAERAKRPRVGVNPAHKRLRP